MRKYYYPWPQNGSMQNINKEASSWPNSSVKQYSFADNNLKKHDQNVNLTQNLGTKNRSNQMFSAMYNRIKQMRSKGHWITYPQATQPQMKCKYTLLNYRQFNSKQENDKRVTFQVSEKVGHTVKQYIGYT